MHPEDYQDFFFDRLIKLRMKKGVSARDMSLSMGQNKGYITNIESKKSYPSLPMFFVICDYLGVTPSEFLNAEDQFPMEISNLISKSYTLNSRELGLIDELIETFSEYKQKQTK